MYSGFNLSLSYSAGNYIEFFSARVSNYEASGPLKGTAYCYTGDSLGSSVDLNNFSSTGFTINLPDSASGALPYKVRTSITNWRDFDYIDFNLSFQVHTITSLNVSIGSQNVPYDLSYIDSNGNIYNYHGSIDSSNHISIFSSSQSNDYFNVSIRIFLSDADKSVDDDLWLSISGDYFMNALLKPRISFGGYKGYILSYSTNPLFYYFGNLQSHLSTLFSDLKNNIGLWISNLNNNIVSALGNFEVTVANWFSTVTSRLDTLIGGSSDGDELSQDSEQISSGLDDIDSFEQSQQAVLDNNFTAIQDTVTITNFTTALAFVQRYTNLAFTGISDFSIVYTLPIFLGLFFYICSRVPGVTRRSKPPKDGDST